MIGQYKPNYIPLKDTAVSNVLSMTSTGQVKWFNSKTGFGFISTDEPDSTDIFVHHSALKAEDDRFRYLAVGERVNFNIVTSDEGKTIAHDVSALSGAKLKCDTYTVTEYQKLTQSMSDADTGGKGRGGKGGKGKGGKGKGGKGKGGKGKGGTSLPADEYEVWELVRYKKSTSVGPRIIEASV